MIVEVVVVVIVDVCVAGYILRTRVLLKATIKIVCGLTTNRETQSSPDEQLHEYE